MKRMIRDVLLALFACTVLPNTLPAQVDTTRVATDTSVQGSVYSRPFVTSLGRTSIGGYAEGNTNYFREDGLTDGFSMELRRFNLFVFSAIAPRVRFFAELEFEHGTEEIAFETAQLDFQIDPAFNLRGGILLVPLGAFNQNHDSPRWEFIDRPLVSTRIIPATLSEVGFGVFGRLTSRRRISLTYDAYATNGLGDGILANDEGRTLLAGGKSPEQFAEDNNGSPALSTRVAVQHPRFGEFGVSFYGGTYNSFREDGIEVDAKRSVTMAAFDFATAVGRLSVRGEAAQSWIELPQGLEELFGARQQGAHLDLVLPVLRKRMLGMQNATLNVTMRLEHIDYNVGHFSSTGQRIGDEVTALVPGISFRPVTNTVFKANYRWHRTRDVIGNPPSRSAGYQVGFATYF